MDMVQLIIRIPHFSNPLWGAGELSPTSDLLNYMKFQMDKNNQSPKSLVN